MTHVLRTNVLLSVPEVMSWAPPAIFGVFVLALPLLAITSRDAVRAARLDLGALILFALLAGELVLIFGPSAYPVMFTVMPVMMVLGWRHGLLGAGLGALFTIVLSLGLSLLDVGIVSKLRGMGYDAAFRGSFLELFFIIVILSSLPLAIIRARQRVTDTKLAEALGAAELRAEQLAVSEAAALQARQELGRVIETSIDIICTLDVDGRFIRVSENCFQIWGWRPEELIGRPWFDFIHEDDRAVAISELSPEDGGQAPAPGALSPCQARWNRRSHVLVGDLGRRRPGLLLRRPRHDRAGRAAGARRPGPAHGRDRAAHRRHRARLQQSAHGDPRQLPGPCAEAQGAQADRARVNVRSCGRAGRGAGRPIARLWPAPAAQAEAIRRRRTASMRPRRSSRARSTRISNSRSPAARICGRFMPIRCRRKPPSSICASMRAMPCPRAASS